MLRRCSAHILQERTRTGYLVVHDDLNRGVFRDANWPQVAMAIIDMVLSYMQDVVHLKSETK